MPRQPRLMQSRKSWKREERFVPRRENRLESWEDALLKQGAVKLGRIRVRHWTGRNNWQKTFECSAKILPRGKHRSLVNHPRPLYFFPPSTLAGLIKMSVTLLVTGKNRVPDSSSADSLIVRRFGEWFNEIRNRQTAISTSFSPLAEKLSRIAPPRRATSS